MKFVIAIPARLESKRLPNKAILDIEGKPMIQRVLERCQETSEEISLVLCTDNEKLASIAKGININGTPTLIIGNKIIPGAINEQKLNELIKEARDLNS